MSVVARHHFAVEDYHLMAKSGILTEDDRVELIKGEIVAMSPIGIRHMSCVNRLNMWLAPLLAGKAIVSVQNSFRINNYSESQPDVTLFRHRDDFYAQELPKIQDALLVIEVSDTTLKYDRKVKLPLYAKAGISEVWIVNIAALERYTKPADGKYTEKQVLQSGASASVLDITVPVKNILG